MLPAISSIASSPLQRTLPRPPKRSREEKRKAVIALLVDENLADWSDSYLARKADVSAPFVGHIRRALSQSVLTLRTTKRRGADGRLRNIKKIGRRPRITQTQRDFVLTAIHLGAWTIAELIDESGLSRPKLQTILDSLIDAKIVITASRNRKSLNGGRPELLYIPAPNGLATTSEK